MAVPTAWMLLSELMLCRSKLCGPPLRWSSVAGDTNLQRENRNWGSAGRVMGMAGTRRRGAAVSGLGLVAVHLGSRHFKYATTQEATSRAGGLLPASLCLYSTPTRCCRSALLCPWEVGALPDALLFFFLVFIWGLSYSMRDLCCSVWDLSLRCTDSPVVSHRLSSCGVRAWLLLGVWNLCSRTRARTCVLCIARQILNH